MTKYFAKLEWQPNEQYQEDGVYNFEADSYKELATEIRTFISNISEDLSNLAWDITEFGIQPVDTEYGIGFDSAALSRINFIVDNLWADNKQFEDLIGQATYSVIQTNQAEAA